MNVLDRMGQSARPALDAMRNAAMADGGHVGTYLNRMVDYLPKQLEAARGDE